MRRISKLLFATLILALVFAIVGCKKDDKKDPTISFETTKMEVKVGETFKLYPIIENLEKGNVEYTFSVDGIVGLSNGTFTALKEGNVTITAALTGYDCKATIQVIVKAEEIKDVLVSEIVISGQSEMEEGASQTLSATVSPDNATNKAITWSSSDDTIATVSNEGKVEAKKAGSVKITATASDESKVVGEINITVNAKVVTVLVSTISFNVVEEMYVGNTQILSASVLPKDATNKNVTWKAEPASVATIDKDGLVTALTPGTVTITATTIDGSNLSCEKTITVKEFVKPEYTAVNPEWEFEELGATVSLFGVEYEIGYSAYANLDQAIQVATKGTYVAPGEYPDNATITLSNFALIGPNASVDPNKVARTDEAIITGTITINSNISNITIKGFAFTKTGMIDCQDTVDTIEVSYNNVYDTNEDATAWSEYRNEAEAVFDFWNTSNDSTIASKNIIIKNNKFSNITEPGIMVARLKNVTISGNGFYNFKTDAIRVEGGYNFGEWLFENNKFINDTMSGYNGIYLGSVSGADDDGAQSITIKNNTFKNIGDETVESSYICAISARTYQECGLTLEILYNSFENCLNYMNLRNNGATSSNFVANINYNKFVGVPKGVYHRNIKPGSDDTSTSNPTLAVMDYNLFLDNDGAAITDLSSYADKLLDLASNSHKNNYSTKAEYEDMIRSLGSDYDIIVNKEWSSVEASAEVEYDNLTYKMGETAFASIDEAIKNATAGAKILVLAGVYEETLTIDKNDITLYGPNFNIYAGNTNRNAEAQLGGKITVSEGVSGFTLNGFEVSGAGQLWLSNGTSNTTFVYNVINAANSDGTVHGPTGANEMTSNLNVSYNYSNNQKAFRFIWIQNLDTLTANYNELTSESAVAYDFLNVQGYIKGKVDIIGNTYKNSLQSFIYAKGVGVIQATIEGNDISGVANTIIDFRGMKEDGANSFIIKNNTFTSSGTGWMPIRIRTANYDANDTISIVVESNKFIDSYYLDGTTPQFVENPSLSDQKDPFVKIYTIGKNYYSKDGTAITELSDANFANAAISFDAAYTTEAECPSYVKDDTISLTSVAITNKIETLNAFASYQLKFTVSPDDATNKKVGFSSSNTKAATVSSAGLVNALSEGTTTITVYSMANKEIMDTFTLTIKPVERIELRYDGTGVLKANETLQIDATYIGEASGTITYTSSDNNIATVDETGKVTAVANGAVTITATMGEIKATIGLTILDSSKLSDLLKLLVENNNGVVMDETFKYIGSDDGSADYEHEIYGSVNNYWAGTRPETTKSMMDMTNKKTYGTDGQDTMTSIEFIVIHDTGSSGSSSTAKANSGWCNNLSNEGSSWHYTVGNDGIYQQLEDNIIAWHAGDGTSWASDANNSTTWYDTGVKYSKERPTVTLGTDGYFYIEGAKTLVKYPTKEGVTPQINDLGLVCVKGENGNYFIPTTWVGSNYNNRICARGGNLNGIGIETAVNMGSDVYLTWQYTAKLVAELLVKHNLAADRVWFHNSFANKPCPRTMMTANLVDMFLEMIYCEYEVASKYSDYTITFTSNNPEILDNTGRIINVPDYSTNVSYTITVTKDGNSESVTLNSLVIGRYN